MSIFKPTALVGAIAIAMGTSVAAYAADDQSNTDDNNVTSLDKIVVTASRTPEKIKNVPARIDVIDKKTIEQSPIADLGQLLKQDAALNIVQSGGIGQTTSIFTRGTNSDHTLILKDGATINTALDGGASIPYLDLTDAERIEILKGPASVQYGSDAIGGVVQIITAPPEKSGAFLTTEYGENNTYKSIVGANLKTDQGFYAQFRGQRMESDGTPVVNTTSEKSSYDQKGYSAKVGYEQADLGGSISIDENKGNSYYYGGNQDFLNRLINAKGRVELASNLTLNARYSHFEDQLTSKSYEGYYNTFRDEGDVNLNWKFTDHQNLLVGATTKDATVKSLSIENGKKNLDSNGYYIQHQYQDHGISTQAGVRLEDDKQYGSHTVGQFAIRGQITPTTSVYANVGSAFKAPTGNQLYYVYEDATWGNTYGNPNLKPEESVTYEVGLDQELPFGIQGYLSAYQTKVKNLIEYVYGYPDSTYDNVDRAKMTGGEVGFKWRKGQYYIQSEYGYVKSINNDTGYDLVRRPRQTFTTTIGLENTRYGLSASLVSKSSSKISESANSANTPGYSTVDLHAYWNATNNIKLFTNIQNVGDVHYKTANYYGDTWYINGGRLATVGVTLSF
ncbi:TonB-dependent receptor plug domain-containing protein [Acinetobacter sp. MB5]|uniref:TonB-dependent receptor plug domain-containing protein n=1 Tax=Acinetobacter sp. MB5 TaxID=2069438 RepID=UPI000DD0A1D9|nr:TonB-dependent receptor [Acinetobacter sp. MB5]